MSSTAVDLRPLSPAARLAAKGEALAAMEGGGVVVAPTDTGYVLLALGGVGGAEVARAARSNPEGGLAAGVWLALDVERVVEVLAAIPPIAAKVIRQLAPGPAVFAVRMDESSLASARGMLGVGPGIVDANGAVQVRVAGSSVASVLAGRAKGTLVCWEPTDDRGRSVLDAESAARIAASLGINPAITLGDGEPGAGGTRGRPTIVALERTGAVRVTAEGAYESRYVMKQGTLNILLVCTGNTCRSPMAEAIGLGLAARQEHGAPGGGLPVKLNIVSAGAGAASGAPRTPEAAKAVRSLGFDPPKGASRPLTKQMIADADLVYGMTRSHVAGVLAIDPSAKEKVSLLDPDGGEVEDPIGLAQNAYNQVAARMESMIERRLKEWRP